MYVCHADVEKSIFVQTFLSTPQVTYDFLDSPSNNGECREKHDYQGSF